MMMRPTSSAPCQRLDSCQLKGSADFSAVLHVTPASFSRASGLTSLSLWGFNEVQLGPRCFSGLTLLKALDLNTYGPLEI